MLRLRPSSFNHADKTEPINTHGKPLLIPKIKMLIKRLSLKYEKYSEIESGFVIVLPIDGAKKPLIIID
tara:strand:+ start:4488 stop:4694 length:207 start_codon:yes stop_codon:yes gene_type:complete